MVTYYLDAMILVLQKVPRIIIKIILTIIIGLVMLRLSFIFSEYVVVLFNIKLDVASVIGERAQYKKFGDLYNTFMYFGIALAASTISVLLIWNTQEKKKLKNWIYLVILFITIPLSIANYWSADIFFDRWKQALVDIIICFCGVMVLLNTLRIRPKSDESHFFKWFAVFLLSSQAILIPAMYAILWFFNFQGLIAKANTDGLNPNWITYLSGIGGLIIAILNYRLAVKKEKHLTDDPNE